MLMPIQISKANYVFYVVFLEATMDTPIIICKLALVLFSALNSETAHIHPRLRGNSWILSTRQHIQDLLA